MVARLGFIIGKEPEDDDVKYNKSFYKNIDKKYIHEGGVSVDTAIPYYISKKWNVEVDIIDPKDITLKRLKQNDINFLIGYDLVTEFNQDPYRYKKVKKIFENKSSNIWPRWEVQNFVYNKGDYAKYLGDNGIPVAPAIQVKSIPKTTKAIQTLVNKIKETGWESVIAKPELSAWSIGIEKIDMDDLNSKRLKQYFNEYKDYPRFIFQQALRGFAKKWEIRLFYFDGKFKYAIGNKAAVATGRDEVVTHNPPKKDLDRVKKIGDKIMKLFPKPLVNGKKIPPTMLRMDFGCCLNNSLDSKDYFLNEIENQACNYFTSHVKFDTVPEYAKVFMTTAQKVLPFLTSQNAKTVGKANKSVKRSRRRSSRRSRRRSNKRRSLRKRRSTRRRSNKRRSLRRTRNGRGLRRRSFGSFWGNVGEFFKSKHTDTTSDDKATPKVVESTVVETPTKVEKVFVFGNKNDFIDYEYTEKGKSPNQAQSNIINSYEFPITKTDLVKLYMDLITANTVR